MPQRLRRRRSHWRPELNGPWPLPNDRRLVPGTVWLDRIRAVLQADTSGFVGFLPEIPG